MLGRVYLDPGSECSFGTRTSRNTDATAAGVAQRQHESQGSAHGAQPAVERELADETPIGQCLGRHGARLGEDAERDRKVEPGPALADVRWGEVHRDAAVRERLAGGTYGRTNAGGRFAHRGLGEPDEVDSRKLRTDADFDFDGDAIDAGEAGGGHTRQGRLRGTARGENDQPAGITEVEGRTRRNEPCLPLLRSPARDGAFKG
jgi:hypothetical protein